MCQNVHIEYSGISSSQWKRYWNTVSESKDLQTYLQTKALQVKHSGDKNTRESKNAKVTTYNGVKDSKSTVKMKVHWSLLNV